MTSINPHVICGTVPKSGFYAGDFAIECDTCQIDLCRHFVDFPRKRFRDSANDTKRAAIEVWNELNPKGQTSGT